MQRIQSVPLQCLKRDLESPCSSLCVVSGIPQDAFSPALLMRQQRRLSAPRHSSSSPEHPRTADLPVTPRHSVAPKCPLAPDPLVTPEHSSSYNLPLVSECPSVSEHPSAPKTVVHRRTLPSMEQSTYSPTRLASDAKRLTAANPWTPAADSTDPLLALIQHHLADILSLLKREPSSLAQAPQESYLSHFVRRRS